MRYKRVRTLLKRYGWSRQCEYNNIWFNRVEVGTNVLFNKIDIDKYPKTIDIWAHGDNNEYDFSIMNEQKLLEMLNKHFPDVIKLSREMKLRELGL